MHRTTSGHVHIRTHIAHTIQAQLPCIQALTKGLPHKGFLPSHSLLFSS
jgi:hypothetical protein